MLASPTQERKESLLLKERKQTNSQGHRSISITILAFSCTWNRGEMGLISGIFLGIIFGIGLMAGCLDGNT
ncbi:hypothetical protein BDE02_07G033500 [Populus trichocarpa]|nr:hypothetical protein BDE02_07G033500 [Populus trichocarpa]